MFYTTEKEVLIERDFERNRLKALAERLAEMEKHAPLCGEGIVPVRTIIMYLKLGNLERAKNVCWYDGDKIVLYPAIRKFLQTELFNRGIDPDTPPHFRLENDCWYSDKWWLV